MYWISLGCTIRRSPSLGLVNEIGYIMTFECILDIAIHFPAIYISLSDLSKSLFSKHIGCLVLNTGTFCLCDTAYCMHTTQLGPKPFSWNLGFLVAMSVWEKLEKLVVPFCMELEGNSVSEHVSPLFTSTRILQVAMVINIHVSLKLPWNLEPGDLQLAQMTLNGQTVFFVHKFWFPSNDSKSPQPIVLKLSGYFSGP